MKYVKKPLEVEAIQFTGTNESLKEIEDFAKENCTSAEFQGGKVIGLSIRTLEINLYASIGDFVVKDIDGNFSLLSPRVFEKIYDLLN